MAGVNDPAPLNECLPDEFKIAAKENPTAATDADTKSTFTTVLDVLSKIIKFVCKFKANIKAAFARKLKMMNKKMFLSSGMQKYKTSKRFWAEIKAAYEQVADWAASAWESVKSFGQKIVDQIVAFYAKIKALVSSFLNSDFVKMIKKMYDCFEKARKTAEAIVKTIKGIFDKVTTIITGGWVGLAKVIVDLICQFDTFRAAFNFLIDGLGEANIPLKFHKYGKFVGTLLKAIGGKRFRSMKLALI
jgi:phage-related protein